MSSPALSRTARFLSTYPSALPPGLGFDSTVCLNFFYALAFVLQDALNIFPCLFAWLSVTQFKTQLWRPLLRKPSVLSPTHPEDYGVSFPRAPAVVLRAPCRVHLCRARAPVSVSLALGHREGRKRLSYTVLLLQGLHVWG